MEDRKRKEYYNVSVRLEKEEYEKLQYIVDTENSNHKIGKVTTAEVIRHAIKCLYTSFKEDEIEKDSKQETTQGKENKEGSGNEGK